MAFQFFTTEKILNIDIRRIPESFKKFYEESSIQKQDEIKALRPDLIAVIHSDLVQQSAKALVEKEDNLSSRIMDQWESMPANAWKHYIINTKVVVCKVIPNGLFFCRIHRRLLERKQLNIRLKDGGIHYVTGLFCPECFDFFLQEDAADRYARSLSENNIPTLVQPLSLTQEEWNEAISPLDLDDTVKLFVPEEWEERSPICPFHDNTPLFPDRYRKAFQGRSITFDAWHCIKCKRIMLGSAAAQRLEDQCGEIGIPIEFSRVHAQKKAVAVSKILIKPDCFIQNGAKSLFTFDNNNDWPVLSEEDTAIISHSRECTINGHEGNTSDELAIIRVQKKRNGILNCLTLLGYCSICRKYYLDVDDFKLVSESGRPVLTLIDDTGTYETITSGPSFAKERVHLEQVESDLHGTVSSIKSQPNYVEKYATISGYDDGDLKWKKEQSKESYKEIEKIFNLMPQPYRYRVDLTSGEKRQIYYLGAEDIQYVSERPVLSFNSRLGRTLANIRTFEITADGETWKVKRRRDFDITNAQLFGFTEFSDKDAIFRAGITDPFLIHVLNTRKRQHQLVDIISTIQENQNAIVDQPIEKNIIVQGCAGSGKTMVLLHRLSSLKYNHPGFDFSSAVILTPNRNFNIHIQNLSSNLQIGVISRYSVEDYYRHLLQLYDKSYDPAGKITGEAGENQDYIDYLYSDGFFTLFSEVYFKKLEEYRAVCPQFSDLLMKLGKPDISSIPNSGYALYTVINGARKTIEDIINLYEADYREAQRNHQKEEAKYLSSKKTLAEHEEKLDTDIAVQSHKALEEINLVAEENRELLTILHDRLEEEEALCKKSEASLINATERLHMHFNSILQRVGSELESELSAHRSRKSELSSAILQNNNQQTEILLQIDYGEKMLDSSVHLDCKDLMDALLNLETEQNRAFSNNEALIKAKEIDLTALERRFFVTRKTEKETALKEEIKVLRMERQVLSDTTAKIHSLIQQLDKCSSAAVFYKLLEESKDYLDNIKYLPERTLDQEYELNQKIQKIDQLKSEEEALRAEAVRNENETSVIQEIRSGDYRSVTVEMLPDYLNRLSDFLPSARDYLEELSPLRRELQENQEEVGEHHDALKRIRSVSAECEGKVSQCEKIALEFQEGVTAENYTVFFEKAVAVTPKAQIYLRIILQQNNLVQEARKSTASLGTDMQRAKKQLVRAEEKRIASEIRNRYTALKAKTAAMTPMGLYQAVFSSVFDPHEDRVPIAFQKSFSKSSGVHRVDLYLRLRYLMMFRGEMLGRERLICIDEGQDLCLNEYRLIREINGGKAVFNIFGDTNQLLKANRGISNWDSVASLLKQTSKYELKENYRNTNQITEFCNQYFEMDIQKTGADGTPVDEIDRSQLEQALSELDIGENRLALILPRTVSKDTYLNREKLPEGIYKSIGSEIGNGIISVVYVDEIKGIEFDQVFAVPNGMSKNEKYIAFSRALSKLTIVIDKAAEIKPIGQAIAQTQRNTDSKVSGYSSYDGITVGKVVKKNRRKAR